MYKKNHQVSLFGFDMANAELNHNNFWIKLSEQVDWDALEDKYAKKFALGGPCAIASRIAIGSLVIKKIIKSTDERTVQHISENPYMQYFIGLNQFVTKAPFGASTMAKFRARIDEKDLADIIEKAKILDPKII